MTERMTAILSRVLSEECANQEIWQKQDIEKFGDAIVPRKEIVEEIKQWMKDNEIPFSYDHYIERF